jgi:hypothetical protein
VYLGCSSPDVKTANATRETRMSWTCVYNRENNKRLLLLFLNASKKNNKNNREPA